MKKYIALFLCGMIITLCLLSACSENSGDNISVTNDVSQTVPEESADDVIIPPDLPPIDYEGYVLNVLFRENSLWPCFDIKAEELSGDILNDAVFERNNKISEKYNITINAIESKSVPDNVKNTVQSGDHSYDLVLDTMSNSLSLSVSKFLIDLNTIPNIDFNKPWWRTYFMENTSILYKNYFCVSDFNFSAYDGTPITLFNKTVHENYNIENIYKLVNDGNWTMDKFAELSRGITDDLDGNGIMDENDLYGATANNFSSDCFLYGTNTYFISKDSDDIPYFDLDNQRSIGVVEKIGEILNDKTAFLLAEKPFVTDREQSPQNAFMENRVLFWVSLLQAVSKLRQMESDFGILPMPKYDSEQESYTSFIHVFTGNMTSIPVTTINTDMIGRIIEDLAYMSHLDVIPAYYEINLNGKYFRDDQSGDMLDIIFSSYTCDLANTLRGAGMNLVNDIRGLITSGNSFSQLIATNENVYTAKMQDVINAFAE